MELLSGYDLISAETDTHIVQHYVATLSTYKVIINGSVKDLQPIVSSINECINSGSLKGKLNGLIVLEELVKDCSSHVFTQVLWTVFFIWKEKIIFSRLISWVILNRMICRDKFSIIKTFLTWHFGPVLQTFTVVIYTTKQ